MDTTHDYYLPDEERFGAVSTGFYRLFAHISPMSKFHGFSAAYILGRKPSRILDIGFGTGEVLRRVCLAAPGTGIYGVEPSSHMLAAALARLRTCNGKSVVNLAMGSSRDIPFHGGFDLVFSTLSFHHWKNQEESLSHILGHLNPGGSFLVFEFAREKLRGYKRVTGGHALALEDLERFSSLAKITVDDQGEYRVVEFRKLEE